MNISNGKSGKLEYLHSLNHITNQGIDNKYGLHGGKNGNSREKTTRERAAKDEILDAAERLFFSRSYEEVSMDEIAREVELNKATIYLYFKNKETLFATIVLRVSRSLKKNTQNTWRNRFQVLSR